MYLLLLQVHAYMHMYDVILAKDAPIIRSVIRLVADMQFSPYRFKSKQTL